MQIFDCHFHVIDPKYKLIENNGYLPPSFTITDYKNETKSFNVIGGAIVSGSFQGVDQEYLKDSIKNLGENYYGVANVSRNMTDKELRELSDSNIVAVRFNLKRGGSAKIDHLEYLSNKLYDRYGWHTELYVESNKLRELRTKLKEIKKFSIDHLGLSKDGLNEVYYWAEKGVKIKATGFGRLDFDPVQVLKRINEINPKALMFGTDLPSTRAKIPFSKNDINLIKNNFNEASQKRIFYKNAKEWYIK